jgi:hypothetical protein
MQENGAAVAAPPASRPNERLPHFVYHGSQHWTVTQIHEAFTELHYTKIKDFIPGKGKKVAARATTLTHVNANSLGGIQAFFDHVAQKISSSAPSFVEAQPPKTISSDTLRKIWDKKLAYRVSQRLSWGKGPNAFFRTGDGDFPAADENHALLSHLPEQERFNAAYVCVQIDDILDSHLESAAKEEIAHRERALQQASLLSSSGGVLENVDQSALSLIVAPPNQHSFGMPMRPSAQEGSVSSASLFQRGAQVGGAVKKRQGKENEGQTTVHKVVAFGESVTSIGSAMLERFKKPSPEEEVTMTALKWGTATKSVTEVVSAAAVNFIKEWKKSPEAPLPKTSHLSRMNPAQLLQSIKSIGTFFGCYHSLDTNIIGCGLDGAILSKMSDSDIKEFLMKDCGVNAVHANILIAKLACWRDDLH